MYLIQMGVYCETNLKKRGHRHLREKNTNMKMVPMPRDI